MSGFVQGATKGSTNGSGTLTTSLNNPTVSGNVLVVQAVTNAGNLGNTTSVSDNFGNTFTLIKEITNGDSAHSLWYAENIVGGFGHTITMVYNTSQADHAAIEIQEFSGSNGATGTLDQVASARGTGTSVSTGATATTTQAGEFVVVSTTMDSSTTVSQGSGYSNLTSNGSGGSDCAVAMESKTVSSTGAQTGTFTLNHSRDWTAIVATFKLVADHYIVMGQPLDAEIAQPVKRGTYADPDAQLPPNYGPGIVGAPTSKGINWPGNYVTGPKLVNIGQAKETETAQLVTGPLLRTTATEVFNVITPAAALPHARDIGDYTADDIQAALLADSRVERFRFELLDGALMSKAFLDDVEISGDVTYAHDNDIKRTAKLTIVETPATVGIRYESDRLKPYYDLLMPDGMWARFPLGVFLLSSPTRSIKGGLVTRDVEAYDLAAMLTQDTTPDRYSLIAGANVIDTVRDILTDHGLGYQIGDSEQVLAVPKDWDPGTSWYQIVADLLSMIAFRPLWFDANGLAQTLVNATPLDRQVDFVYPDDSLSVLDPEMSEALDLWDVPNVWVLIASTPTDQPIVSTYKNQNPESPTSTTSRGREVTKVVSDGIDATTQDALDSLAQNMAFEDSQIYQTLSFATAIMPQHDDYNVLHLIYGAFDVDALYAESDWSITLTAGTEMTHAARRVVDVRRSLDDDVVLSNTQIIHQVGETEIAQSMTATKVPAQTAHTDDWTSTYHRTYPGGTNVGYRSPEPSVLYAGSNGNQYGIHRGIIGFNWPNIQANLVGATITSCYFTFKQQGTYYSSGAYWWVGTHTYTSIPVNWDGPVHVSGLRRIKLHVVAGTTYKLNCGIAIGNDFKSGAALGIAIGPPVDGNFDAYGYMASSPMILEINYKK